MVNLEELERIGRELLIAIGEDPNREGIQDTPRRFAKWWQEFMDYDSGTIDTSFSGINTDAVIAVTNLRVWSLCEHHLLPFSSTISIGYIPTGRVLGLSKFARIAHMCAHRLQLQERLVNEIADEMSKQTGSQDVAVIASGEHLCMTMRGIKTYGSMRTSVMRGAFKDNEESRAEFLMLVKE
jgi:GTP cyclohydrolase I